MADPDFWSGTYGAVVGSIVGGLIALGGQWLTILDVRKTRSADVKMERKALSHSIILKTMRIHSNFMQIDNHWKESNEKANALEIWQYLLPLVNLPEKIKFENRELALLLTLNDNKLFNDVLELDAVHNALLDSLGIYNNKYEELTAKFVPAGMTGDVGHLEFNNAELLKVRPLMVIVNSLGAQIGNMVARDATSSSLTLDELASALREKAGSDIKIERKN